MKRRIMNAYARRMPERVKQLIPNAFKSWCLGVLYRRTLHPDFGFKHVQLLRQMGQNRKAANLYAQPEAVKEMNADNITDDPLFKSSLTPELSRKDVGSGGYFQAEFGYRGLMLGGKLIAGGSAAPSHIDIILNDQLLRREKLSFSKGIARFQYIIQRSSLSGFPQHSHLKIITSEGLSLFLNKNYDSIVICLPHADESILDLEHLGSALDKKGERRLSVKEIEQRQDQYLDLYGRVRRIFQDVFNKPLFILYGTLLGQHRSGDFIPGDDDFDVGYVSGQNTFSGIKSEAIEMMETLVKHGLTVSLNREGKLFRITDYMCDAAIYLDNRPVFSQGDGFVWMHKQARLKLDLQGFSVVEKATLRGVTVLKPNCSEAFLAAYYGAGWAVPDPSFSNKSKKIDPFISKKLATLNMSHAEQRDLKTQFSGLENCGDFTPVALSPLYPIREKKNT